MKNRKLWLLVLAFSLVCSTAHSQDADFPYTDSTLSINKRVEDLLSRMSLKEKVYQMRFLGKRFGRMFVKNGEFQIPDNAKKHFEYGIAGIKGPGEHLKPVKSAKFNNRLQKYIIDHNQWGIPALFPTEAYNGVDAVGCTKFGRPIAMAASFNPKLVHHIWDVIGREARFRGFHMCHSPEADLARDPRYGRMSETFGEDTYLTTQMVVAAIKGVQGDYQGVTSGTHIGAVVKHFAAYAQVGGGTNFASVEISPRTLADEILPPFKAAVQDAHTLGLMVSHVDINGVASHANHHLLTDILRNQWGFKGYVVSDANDIARLHTFMHVAVTPEDAAILGLKAGVDADLYGGNGYALLSKIAENNSKLKTLINQAAGRVLRTKFLLGLFDHSYVNIDKVKENERSPKNLKIAKKADLESIILLKNDKKTLPLDTQKKKTIALLGPLLDEGAKSAFEKIAGKKLTFLAEKGFNLTDQDESVPQLLPPDHTAVDQLVQKAKKADMVVLFLGGNEFTSKESYFNKARGDRASINPVGPQDDLLKKIKKLGKPVVVVLKHRRTLSINTISEKADAILDCWDLSEFGDEAVAKMIFGKAVPSGKLPVTVPRSIGQLPYYYSLPSINKKKGYLFMKKGPLYPFGFGLSYTSFSFGELTLSSKEITPNSKIIVSIPVTNTGKLKAKEVVQLYLKDEYAQVLRPDKELKGFQKIELKPGETKTVSFIITPQMLKFTGLQMKRILEEGKYKVMVGSSSESFKTESFQLKM